MFTSVLVINPTVKYLAEANGFVKMQYSTGNMIAK